MLGYAVRRVLWIIPVMLVIATVTFVLMHFVPGGPWDRDKPLPPQVVETLNQRYGLDDPLWKQYFTSIGDALQGDLGVSYTFRDRQVTDIIRQGLPATLTLAGVAFAIAVIAREIPAMTAAINQNSPIDYITMSLTTVLASIPGFVLGMMMVIFFAVEWNLLPTGGWGSPSHAVLPAALIARVTRASVLEVLAQDYVRTARAKGLPSWVLHYRHVLKTP